MNGASPVSAPPRRFDVAAFGETMGMLVAEDVGDLADVRRFYKRIAGADSNVAIGLARLGLAVAWTSRVGNDSFGRFILATLAAEGLDCAGLTVDPARPTGLLFKSRRDDGGDPDVEYFRRGSAAAALNPADMPAARLLSARHLHCTGIPPALSPSARALTLHAMATMRQNRRTISFDPNLRPTLWPSQAVMRREINALAARADWVLPGLAEGQLLTGRKMPEAIADFYLERGASEVIVKLGADGAFWKTGTAQQHCPAYSVARVIDTVGAGDGFAAGYISARLEDLAPEACLDRATQAGALAIQVAGDMEGLPQREALTESTARGG
jgi:sugar/nucleoside kinase (ribokinase family)